MSSFGDVNHQPDPTINSTQAQSNAASAQEQATNLAYAAKNSEVCGWSMKMRDVQTLTTYSTLDFLTCEARINPTIGAASALNSVQNSQIAQDLASGLVCLDKRNFGSILTQNSSPAAQTVKKEAAATSNEFSDLANSRKVPEHTAANDTPLTRMSGPWISPLLSDGRIDYHSFFFNLLSWRNPSK